MTDHVIKTFNLKEDDFDKVQEIILENALALDKKIVIDFFQRTIVCPHCLSLDGKNCPCSRNTDRSFMRPFTLVDPKTIFGADYSKEHDIIAINNKPRRQS